MTPSPIVMEVVNDCRGCSSENFPKLQPQIKPSENDTIQFDFCYMTSSPIVMEKAGKEYPIPQLDFTKEANDIVEIIQECGKEVRYCTITATIANFVTLIQKKVRILHFSGHGRQDE